MFRVREKKRASDNTNLAQHENGFRHQKERRREMNDESPATTIHLIVY